MAKLHIKKGDNVMVIAGNNKGESGRVLVVNVADNTAIVEGVNMMSKNTRPNANNPKGGILKQEAPVHVSNLMLMDKGGNPTRTGIKIDETNGKKFRFSKKSGEAIK
jgi:large subunit ribosomal protein L24